jgi:hypothetical protein
MEIFSPCFSFLTVKKKKSPILIFAINIPIMLQSYINELRPKQQKNVHTVEHYVYFNEHDDTQGRAYLGGRRREVGKFLRWINLNV